jgi:hypothetical protein
MKRLALEAPPILTPLNVIVNLVRFEAELTEQFIVRIG